MKRDDKTKLLKSAAQPIGVERWIRVPRRGVEPATGFCRSKFYELIGQGKIKSASIKEPGQLRGVRLVWLPSVMAYIEKFSEGKSE